MTVMSAFLRATGFALAVGAAGSLLWGQIQNDARASRIRAHNLDLMKQTYRTQAAILTCWDYPGLLDPDRPAKVTKRLIPPPESRQNDFDYVDIDGNIDEKQCRIDTSPQNIGLALHDQQYTQPVSVSRARRFAAGVY
jgi:hypothetical protein